MLIIQNLLKLVLFLVVLRLVFWLAHKVIDYYYRKHTNK